MLDKLFLSALSKLSIAVRVKYCVSLGRGFSTHFTHFSTFSGHNNALSDPMNDAKTTLVMYVVTSSVKPYGNTYNQQFS